MGRTRKIAVACAAAALVVQVIGVTVASSQKVGNPSGPFTYTIHNAALQINAQSFNFDDQRVPQCRDGVNNDTDFLGSATVQDNAIDWPADPECANANDDSEVVAGNQPVLPVTVTGGISAAGVWTVNPTTGVFFPPSYAFADNPAGGTFVVTVAITGRTGAPGAWTGNLNPLTGEANLAMQLRVTISGGPINATCHIGDDTGGDTLVAQASSSKPGGVPYDTSTGSLTMADQGFRVPPAKDCGTIIIVNIADQINSSFGIPTTNTSAAFTGDFPAGNRPTKAINPVLNANPGVACRATTFTTTGSSSIQTINNWKFDDTNDGSFEQDGASSARSATYNTQGSKTARVRATDSQGDFADATTTFTVGPNLPPTAPNQNLPRSAAGAPVNFTLGGTDPEGGTVGRTIIVNPVNGTISGTGPSYTYTPNPGFTGPDVLTYQTSDDCAESSNTTGTVTFNVNRTPTADGQTVNTNQDIPVNIALSGTDLDGDALTYTVATNPANGVLDGTAPALQYTPNPGFFGTDSFTFNVHDGLNGSTTAGTVTVIVAKNTRPVADPQIVTLPEDGDTDITLTASDADGDTLSYTTTSLPAHGVLTGTAPNLHYEPADDYNGSDSFTFSVNDGKGGTNSATVTINVTPVNDAPVATDQNVLTQVNQPKPFTVNASDADLDTLTFTPTDPVDHGVITGSFPNFTYTPASGYIGPDSLSYTVNDGNGGTASATISFDVAPTNLPPVAGSAVVNTNEDTAKGILLNASGPEAGDAIDIAITTDPLHGELSGTAPNLTYTPDPNYFGSDSFQFTVTDQLGQSTTGTISINVLAVNDAPLAQAQTVSATEDTPKAIVLGATDVDSAPITYQVVTLPAHGTVTGTAPNVTYTPAPNYNGPDSFTFRARDPQGAQTTATVSIDVAAVNDVPKATALSKTVAEDGTVAVTLAGTDVDGTPLTFAIVANPTKGVLTGSSPNLTYEPNDNLNGFDTFTYTASDGTATSPAAVATIAITAVNDAPVANAQALTTLEDTPLAVVLGGSDVDGDAITYKVTVAPAHGTLTGTAPNVTYKPAADYNGSDSFTFTVTDPKGLKGTAVISIDVTPAPMIATKIVSVPNIKANLGLLSLKWNYPNMKGTLQRLDNSAPLAGKTLDFYLGTSTTKACSGVTNSAGTATCSGSFGSFVGGYTVKFAGDADFGASSASATVTQ